MLRAADISHSPETARSATCLAFVGTDHGHDVPAPGRFLIVFAFSIHRNGPTATVRRDVSCRERRRHDPSMGSRRQFRFRSFFLQRATVSPMPTRRWLGVGRTGAEQMATALKW